MRHRDQELSERALQRLTKCMCTSATRVTRVHWAFSAHLRLPVRLQRCMGRTLPHDESESLISARVGNTGWQ
jgi:hypothetical protein